MTERHFINAYVIEFRCVSVKNSVEVGNTKLANGGWQIAGLSTADGVLLLEISEISSAHSGLEGVAVCVPEIPVLRNLNISPACHTRSNALLISKKTTRTSLPSFTAVQNWWYSSSSWVTVEQPGRNRDCHIVKMKLSLKYSNMYLNRFY